MKQRYVAALVLVVLVAALGSAAAVPDRKVLVVADAETGETYLEVPVENGTVVALEYMHSVEKTRIYEAYTVRGDRLVMSHMEFESYGWGLPSRANVTRENGTFIYDPPGSYERLTVAPGRIAGHTLHVGDRTYDLVALSDTRSVTLSIQRRSALTTTLDGVDR
ncbi:DUF1850 domain-containing protein [Haloplanus aerogenes]|uniref:DUF1850 domain-containing protein n=1 Tax=Haloplanus aerogenes TaxID=660522 RepID=A0A3M0CX22_9EURY|nr:DUF1850 domain-containing protein [Haloplanus aerogenes]AZH27005.1 DUF1850 domain-containing protein [Haloplanus aerogenes]RMB13504.1 hypothetical protein ATH50_2842 [Haloplanus aerogenes]